MRIIVFLGNWAVGSTIKSVILTLLIVAPGVPMMLFLKRWNKQRAIRQVVSIFKKHNAIGVENARPVGKLGLKPLGPMIELLVSVLSLATQGRYGGGEDVRQDALDYLKQASIVKETLDGRLYLALVPCEDCGHNNIPNTFLCAECGANLVNPGQQAPIEEPPGYEAMRRAGTLNIFSGAFIVFVGVSWLVIPVVGTYVWAGKYGGKLELESLLPGLLIITCGLLVLVSGIFARRGERWGLALIGSIISLPVPFLGAIAAMSLIQARYEWPNSIRWTAYVILAVVGLGIVAIWALLAAI